MDAICKLVKDDGWTLVVWPQRYGSGIWAIIGQQAGVLHNIQDITTGGDIEALELESYFNESGSWLPVAFGRSVTEAINALDQKISPLIDNEEWQGAVFKAFERINEESMR